MPPFLLERVGAEIIAGGGGWPGRWGGGEEEDGEGGSQRHRMTAGESPEVGGCSVRASHPPLSPQQACLSACLSDGHRYRNRRDRYTQFFCLFPLNRTFRKIKSKTRGGVYS